MGSLFKIYMVMNDQDQCDAISNYLRPRPITYQTGGTSKDWLLARSKAA